MSSFLEISQLGKTYDTPKGPAVIVKNFNLRIAQGRIRHAHRPLRLRQIDVLSMVAGLTDVTTGGVILAGKESSAPARTAASFSRRPVCCRG